MKAKTIICVVMAAASAVAATYRVDLDRPDGIYRCGETATFSVRLLEKKNLAETERPFVGLDNFGTTVLTNMPFDVSATGVVFKVSGTLREPGFLRLSLPPTKNGRGDPFVFSAGFEPEKIRKGSPSPKDFDTFWADARTRLAREVPLDAQVVRVPERNTKAFDFYRISFATFGRRVHGYMSVPTDKSKAPFAVDFEVNAAGFGDWTNDMKGSKDAISVRFSVYPFAPDWKWRKSGLEAKYKEMDASLAARFGAPRYCQAGITESREDYFFYPVILGIDRAVNWVAARPDVDRSRIRYQGTSQGGGFGFYLCGLNHTFTRAAFYVPAITDTMGYLKGRQSGWPQVVENNSSTPARRAAAEKWAPYFDGANFASRITCPVRVAVGFSDTTCPPCAVYAAYNEIKVKDKAIGNGIGMTHSCRRQFYSKFGKWAKISGERERLLRPFREKLRRVMFTKHFDMGGSHYAYTDAVSDEDKLNPGGVVKEFNFKPGSSLCMLSLDEGLNVSETKLLHDDNGVIRDPDVSYDGTRILFAWKKSAHDDDYHLYEMDVATRKVRQLTFGKGVADYEGVYLPDGNIMFSSTRCFQNVDCWHVSVCNMFLMDGDGRFMRRIGFDQVHSNYPQVHPGSGAVTYTRWEYNDRGQIYPQPLFQMHPNGAHQQEFYGNTSYFPTSILHARGIPGTQKVLAVLSGHHTPQKGKLAIIDPSLGREETAGVTLVAPEEKPKGQIRIDKYGQKGDQWQYPYPLDEDNYLVTFRPDGAKHFGIYFMNRKGERVLLAEDPVVSCNQPIPLAPRPKPPQVGYPIDWSKTNGTFTVKDVYAGPGLKGVARGTVKKLRVVALDFMATDIGRKHGPSAISDLAAWDVKVVLGETPVHDDGSAVFEVPARTPVYFQAIDGNGHVVQTMRSWSTLMPGETFSCVGCHAYDSGTVSAKANTLALQKGVAKLQPFYDVSGRGFSFPKTIQPILDAKCVKCHNGVDAPAPDLRATPVWDEKARKLWNKSYSVLVSTDRAKRPANDTNQVTGTIDEHSRYVNWIGRWSVPTPIPPYSHGSSRSPLVRMLAKGHHGVKMSQEELDKIACWIDLAVPHSGTWTEGMMADDEAIYLRVRKLRDAWRREEAANIADYLKHQKAASSPPVTLPSRLTLSR